MAIENGNINAMLSFGNYYERIDNNTNHAIEYYLMAIQRNNKDAMDMMASLYYNINDYFNSLKYYQMCVDNSSDECNCRHLCDCLVFLPFIKVRIKEIKPLALQQISTDPSNIERKIANGPNECMICSEDKDMLLNFNCGGNHDHCICVECCNSWYIEDKHKLKCVFCTNEINVVGIKLQVKN